MMLLKKTLLPMIAVLSVIVPSISYADIAVPFMDVTCDQSNQSAIVLIDYVGGDDSPEALMNATRAGKIKNKFLVNDLVQKPQPFTVCELKNTGKITIKTLFNTNSDGLTARNNLMIYFNDQIATRIWMAKTPVRVAILALSPDEFRAQICFVTSGSHFIRSDMCEEHHFKAGKELTE